MTFLMQDPITLEHFLRLRRLSREWQRVALLFIPPHDHVWFPRPLVDWGDYYKAAKFGPNWRWTGVHCNRLTHLLTNMRINSPQTSRSYSHRTDRLESLTIMTPLSEHRAFDILNPIDSLRHLHCSGGTMSSATGLHWARNLQSLTLNNGNVLTSLVVAKWWQLTHSLVPEPSRPFGRRVAGNCGRLAKSPR